MAARRGLHASATAQAEQTHGVFVKQFQPGPYSGPVFYFFTLL
jgi:hypothetical protein